MSSLFGWILGRLKQLSELGNPGLVQAIIIVYFTALGSFYTTGNLESDIIKELTYSVLVMIFFSYAFGFIILDKEYD